MRSYPWRGPGSVAHKSGRASPAGGLVSNVRVGDEFTSRGGWLARVIWVRTDGSGFYTVHKPDTAEEVVPVYHFPDGRALPIFVVCPPPHYNGDPADVFL